MYQKKGDFYMNKKDFKLQIKLSEKQRDLAIASLDFSYNLFLGNTSLLIEDLINHSYMPSDSLSNLIQRISTGVRFAKDDQYIRMEKIIEEIEKEKEEKKMMLREKMKELKGLMNVEDREERKEEENPFVKIMLHLVLLEDGSYLEVNQEESNHLIQALDLYSRVLAGQFDEIKFRLTISGLIDPENNNIVKGILADIKSIVYPFLSNGEYLGIYQKDCPETSKITYDLIQVIRHKIAWHNNPGGGITVDFGEPLRSSNDESLCEVNIVVD
jgi:hypothetical protein